MTETTRPAGGGTGGVDTHLDVHVCVAVCSVTMGRLGAGSFPATGSGYSELLSWLETFGTVDRVGIEGTSTYGAGLARLLSEAGVTVIEVNRPDRSGRRTRGKSDDLDAEAAARSVLSGQATAVPKAHTAPSKRSVSFAWSTRRRSRTGPQRPTSSMPSSRPPPNRCETSWPRWLSRPGSTGPGGGATEEVTTW